jgi:hypothetical protein
VREAINRLALWNIAGAMSAVICVFYPECFLVIVTLVGVPSKRLMATPLELFQKPGAEVVYEVSRIDRRDLVFNGATAFAQDAKLVEARKDGGKAVVYGSLD